MALKSKSVADVRPTVPVEEVTKEDTLRVNFNVPASMQKRWKKAAIDRGVTLGAMIMEIVERELGTKH